MFIEGSSREGVSFLEALDIARRIVEIAGDKQASDIVLLDIREVIGFTDYFVICTSETARQTGAIADEITARLKKEGIRPHHVEGTADSGWVLIDYYDIIVHIFGPKEREYYQLDRLWSKANTILHIQ